MKTAVLLGMGGLGCPAALALSEAGVPLRLVLVDPDRVERSNLSRQILYSEADVGALKAEAAARKLRNAQPRALRFEQATTDTLLTGADVVLDGTDNFETRFFANDECVRRGLPLIHGAALGWQGQAATIVPGTGCLRCLFEGPPPPGAVPACAEAGVLSPLCGVVGAFMARAALALLFHSEPPELGVLRRWDALQGTERPLPLRKDVACAVCASRAS